MVLPKSWLGQISILYKEIYNVMMLNINQLIIGYSVYSIRITELFLLTSVILQD